MLEVEASRGEIGGVVEIRRSTSVGGGKTTSFELIGNGLTPEETLFQDPPRDSCIFSFPLSLCRFCGSSEVHEAELEQIRQG